MVWTITSRRNQVKRKRVLTPFPSDPSDITESLSQKRPSGAKVIDQLLPLLWRHLVEGFGLAHRAAPFFLFPCRFLRTV
jgi:hypothetical protein